MPYRKACRRMRRRIRAITTYKTKPTMRLGLRPLLDAVQEAGSGGGRTDRLGEFCPQPDQRAIPAPKPAGTAARSARGRAEPDNDGPDFPSEQDGQRDAHPVRVACDSGAAFQTLHSTPAAAAPTRNHSGTRSVIRAVASMSSSTVTLRNRRPPASTVRAALRSRNVLTTPRPPAIPPNR